VGTSGGDEGMHWQSPGSNRTLRDRRCLRVMIRSTQYIVWCQQASKRPHDCEIQQLTPDFSVFCLTKAWTGQVDGVTSSKQTLELSQGG
jgi:hypothetical protein